jgi:hypothetical protein
MMRYRNPLEPPPPSREMAQSAAYRALMQEAREMLWLLEVEVAEQGGIATIDLDEGAVATRMHRPAFVATLDQLAAAGFITISMSERFCGVALSSAWRRT